MIDRTLAWRVLNASVFVLLIRSCQLEGRGGCGVGGGGVRLGRGAALLVFDMHARGIVWVSFGDMSLIYGNMQPA